MSISKCQPVSRSQHQSRPKLLSKVSTNSRLDRLRRIFALGVCQSPTKAKASSTRASISSAKKARRSKERRHGKQQETTVSEAPYARPEQASWRHGQSGPCTSFRPPFEQEHQRPADRRCKRGHAGVRILARKGSGCCWQEQCGSRNQSGHCNRRARQKGRR